MPGIIVQTRSFGGFFPRVALSEDLRRGPIHRFARSHRALGIARGPMLADLATDLLFGYAFSWVFA